MNALTTVQKDTLLVEVEGDSPMDELPIVRKLTPEEAWRLMAFTDEDFRKAKERMNQNCYSGKDRSESQLYKQAGNSIVVDVLLYILQNLYDAMPYLFEDVSVGSFFSGIGAFEKALTLLGTEKSSVTELNSSDPRPELTQIGYINDYNGDANRIYDSIVARTLKAEAGGGGAKTGWYKINPKGCEQKSNTTTTANTNPKTTTLESDTPNAPETGV